MFVLGMAGHVDHGKSTFLRALTGMEPDRLPEEKQRGMTIDLNFVWLTTREGQTVGIVDVPGHHRFVKNMIAGVMNINAFMLVVAADDGWMPQSEEHLQVLKSLGVNRGLVLVTKTDLVESDRVAEVRAQCSEKVELELGKEIEVLTFGATKPDNLPEIRDKIEQLLKNLPAPTNQGVGRVWIDRVFKPKGLGVVATGTLTEGKIQAGQEVVFFPSKRKAQIKAIQSYQKDMTEALPVSRVAIQLTKVQSEEVERGYLLQTSEKLRLTDRLDAMVTFFSNPPKKNVELSFRLGTMHAPVLLIPFEGKDKGTLFARLKFKEDTPVRTGERFLLRTPGEEKTIAGGMVIDACRPIASHRKAFEKLEKWSPNLKGQLEYGFAKDGVINVAELANSSIYSREQIETLLRGEHYVEVEKDRFARKADWDIWAKGIQKAVEKIHQDKKAAVKESDLREEARELGLPHGGLVSLLSFLVRANQIKQADGGYRIAGQEMALDPEEKKYLQLIEKAFKEKGGEPFDLRTLGPNQKKVLKLKRQLVQEKRVISLSQDYVLDPSAYSGLCEKVIGHLKAKEKATTSELKGILNASRKNAVLYLEKMDSDRITYLKEGVRRLLR